MRNLIRRSISTYQLGIIRKLLSGPSAWEHLDALGIPGLGTNLARFLFPLRQLEKPSWGFGQVPHQGIKAILDRESLRFIEMMPTLKSFAYDLTQWPIVSDSAYPEMPHLQNEFIPLADAVVLYGMLRHFQPLRYVEVGSGISTKIAHQAKRSGKLEMQIISIDPEPRQQIDNLSDTVIRNRLEDVPEVFFRDLSSGDLLFFDGSHYCFPGNDVVVFFLRILPMLPPGIRVHVHDIYWPEDYSPDVLKQLWSEQYLLGAWLLGGGQGIRITFPAAYMSKRPEMSELLDQLFSQLAQPELAASSWQRQGTSFWFETV